MKLRQIRIGWLVLAVVVGWGEFTSSFALRDPTQPATAAVNLGASSSLVVTMIKISHSQALANVNGKMIKVGDEINGVTVVAIKSDAVSFKAADNTILVVPLHRHIVEKKIKGEIHESKK